jgi:group I intron endonuclease
MLVYCIKNSINGKEYVGLTTRSLEIRWKQHIQESNKEGSWEYKTPLGLAIKKYGKEAFDVFIVEKCDDLESTKQAEIRLIKERKSHVSAGGYNITKGGDGRFGTKWSQEIKDKISIGNKGKVMSDQSKEKMKLAKKDKYLLGDHPKAVTILVDKCKSFSSIKEFTNQYNLTYSTIVSLLSRNNGKVVYNNILIERI